MFWTRLASGVVLLILAIGTMAWGGVPLALLLWLISMIAFRELTKALSCAGEGGRCSCLEWLGLGGITAYYLLLYFTGDATFLLMCIVGAFMGIMLLYVVTFPKHQAGEAAGVFFSFVYAPVLLSFVYLVRECSVGIFVVWMILISSWGCDTCAYVVGKLVGKKKIFPVLSPKKSLEGCVGGVLGAALLGYLYGAFYVEKFFPGQMAAWVPAVICGVGAVMSMVGDLAASAVKRNTGIKDYGKLIPGHGGIMDRFDSTIVTAPMTYFLTVLLL